MRDSGGIRLSMGIWLEEEVMGVASMKNPEMVSSFVLQLKVMEESLTSVIRTRRGGLISS